MLEQKMGKERSLQKAEWINNMKEELSLLEESPKVEIHPDELKTTLKKYQTRIHGFLFKKVTSIHDKLATEMNKWIHKTEVPVSMSKGKTTLIQKGPLKGLTNNRPMICQPMMQ